MVIFSDGFETNDFSAWTRTNNDAGCSITVSNTQKHTGSYSAYVVSGGGWGADAEKDFAAQTTAYLRQYVYWTAFPGSGKSTACCFIMSSASYGLAGAGVTNDAGTIKWVLYAEDGGTNVVLATDNPALNTWYCIEVKGVKGNGTGEARFYLEGTEKLSLTNLTQNVDIERIGVGEWAMGVYSTPTCYIDCVVADSSYIGPEGAPPGVTVKKGGSLPSMMMQMLNSKILFNACRIPQFSPRAIVKLVGQGFRRA